MIEKITLIEESQDISREGLRKSALKEKIKFATEAIDQLRSEKKPVPAGLLQKLTELEEELAKFN